MLPSTKAKITVTPLAADARFKPADAYPAGHLATVRERHGLPESFILTTGTLEPRKNLERLIAAYAALPGAVRTTTPLVLAGKRGWQEQSIFDAIAALPDPTQIRHVDFVPDEDLAALYAAATLFCYPSLYEGFGLPVLEAMQSGVPVITSNVSSLPEVGGSAVRYVDPLDAPALTAALKELLGDAFECNRLSNAALLRAKQFSWGATASATLEVLRRATTS
jgi:alpha-1,3-rhamnosyl/mannosyltransferase